MPLIFSIVDFFVKSLGVRIDFLQMLVPVPVLVLLVQMPPHQRTRTPLPTRESLELHI